MVRPLPFCQSGELELKLRQKILFIEHIDDELTTILQECEKSDIQILALLVNLYRADANIVELNLQHSTIIRADHSLRKRFKLWVEEHAPAIKEDIDWQAFKTPYESSKSRLKFLLRLRAAQFDATVPDGLARMRRLAKSTKKKS